MWNLEHQPERPRKIITLENNPALIGMLNKKLVEYKELVEADTGEVDEKYQLPMEMAGLPEIPGMHLSLTQPKAIDAIYKAAILERLLSTGSVDQDALANELSKKSGEYYGAAFVGAYKAIKSLTEELGKATQN